MTPGQRFDALIFAALDVSDTAQADALCRAFPALWAQWAQDPSREQDPRAVLPAGVHEAWCDLLSDHAAPQGCLPAGANPAAGAGYDVERLRALGPRMAGAGCDRERCRWPLGSHAPTCQAAQGGGAGGGAEEPDVFDVTGGPVRPVPGAGGGGGSCAPGPATGGPGRASGYLDELPSKAGRRLVTMTCGCPADGTGCAQPAAHGLTDPDLPHHHSETGPRGCHRCELARSFPLAVAEEIEARLAAEPHTHSVTGPVGCPRCDRYRRDARAEVYGVPLAIEGFDWDAHNHSEVMPCVRGMCPGWTS